ncbi:MAG TPA: TIGR03986 family CRISPR-associated RAMP protein, partial [Sulfurimonas autotrophica]|nr:TIGR03986 family CRISPR-associated RAMP protein [Sulfurimonas autotrophica]
MITAPFNFVPLSEKVFYPDWAEDVSHDIPFEDGESGVIDITITAKSPIFIRDGQNDEEFCQHNGTYYIPGSSVKGMVRNVLEIMSFSKMSQVDDDTYAVRDLSSAKNFYMTQMQKDVYCGWLSQDKDGYFIEDCGIAERIRHEEIDKATGIEFAKNFKKEGFKKTSEYKYDILRQTHQKIQVSKSYKSTTNAKYDRRLFCKYEKNGRNGVLVVTGQPTPRKDTGKGDGKGFEFVFFDKKEEIRVSKETYENFLFAYFDQRTTEPKESPDWKFWKKKLAEGKKVPVFFQKNGKEVAHFGLSYLYKLPYTHSVKDGIFLEHKKDKRDLAETMFGYIGKDESLKGRIHFSHFKAIKNEKALEKRTEILGTPRASYYPIYVKQQEGKLFTTFMDSGFSISGWKRYPIHKGANVKETTDTGNDNVGTTFAPLNKGVVFHGKVRYHNLKKSELGALLSTFSFHNEKE